MKRFLWTIVLCTSVAVLITGSANAQSYQATGLPKLGTSIAMAEAKAINDNGISVGWSATLGDGGNATALYWDANGTMRNIGSDYTGTGRFIWARSINNSGVVVGDIASGTVPYNTIVTWNSGSVPRVNVICEGNSIDINEAGQILGYDQNPGCFLWESGYGVTQIPTLAGATSTTQGCLNNAGQVAGTARIGGLDHIWTWTKQGGLSDLGTIISQPDSYCEVGGINDLGQVAGVYGAIMGSSPWDMWEWRHGFIRKANGELMDIGVAKVIYGINNGGQVIGEDMNGHAFVWDRIWGRMYLPALPGDNITMAYGINDAGVVVGKSRYYDGNFWVEHPTVWTPVPEPSCVSCLIFGLAGSGLVIGRRRRAN